MIELEYGSYDTFFKTLANKVDLGWILNGNRKYIENATFSGYFIEWARNSSNNYNIQAFLITKASYKARNI